VAERRRFELLVPEGTTVFETVTLLKMFYLTPPQLIINKGIEKSNKSNDVRVDSLGAKWGLFCPHLA